MPREEELTPDATETRQHHHPTGTRPPATLSAASQFTQTPTDPFMADATSAACGWLDNTDTVTACAGTAGSGGLLRPRTQHGGRGRMPVRAIKTTTISILAVGLLAGSAVGVAAQDEDPMAPSTFTVQRSGEPEVTTDPSGAIIVVGPVEATDQRASGTLTEVAVGAMVDVADGDSGRISSDAVRLVNDGGSWVGSNRGFLTFSSDEQPPTVQFLGELVGEGGYEGLTMFFAQTGDAAAIRWLGVIVPTDDIPAVPELPTE